MNLSKKHSYYNNEFFGRWAWIYDFEKYIFRPFRKRAVKFANLQSPQKVLDVATGTGALAFEFAILGHDVIGIDLSPEMLAQAKKKISPNLKLNFQEGDGTELPFKDKSFDLTTIPWGIHDMPYEVGIQVLKEMKRVTKDTGYLLVVDYMEPKKHKVAIFTHPLISLYETKNYKPFIEKGIKLYIKDIGLEVVREGNYLGVWQMLLLK
jgi:ubiquinone/menaquinone biosynthesis C-methylase UbiE